MAGGYKFAPLNVRAVYQNDGSAKSSFLAEVSKMTSDAERMFKDFSNEARTQLDAALSVKRNNAGSLDLGVDELRAAAAAQQARATAAREVAAATALAAREEGDYSQKARLAVAASQALAIEEEKAAASARAHAQAAEQVQERLNRQASATDLVVAATRRGTTESSNVINGLRAQRAAYGQLGQQLQDVVVQTQMGTSATTIFTQQVPQMAFALSGLADSTNRTQASIGKVATFLSGPWGAAIFAATAVLAPFVLKILQSGDALDEQAKKLSDAAKAADSYGNAQSILSQVIDLTTGKLKTQNSVLVQTIKLQAQANILAAQAAQKSGLGKVKELGDRTTVENLGAAFKGIGNVLGGGKAGDEGRKLNSALAPLRQDVEAYRKSAEDYQKVLNDPKAGAAAIEAASARFNKSLDTTLDKLSTSAKKGNRDVIATKQQVLELGAALNDQRANQLVVDAVSGKPLDPLLKPYKAPATPKKPAKDTAADRAAKAAVRLGEFGEDASKKIANIRDSFADIPPEVERINRASRELDDIISDLMNRQPKGFEALKAEAEALKSSLADGVVTQALTGMEESSQRQLQVQELLLSGREAEAAALQNLWQIEQRIGSETDLRTKAQALILQGRNEEAAVLTRIANQYPRIRTEVQDIAEAEQRRIEAMRQMQEIQAVFLDATRSVRGEVEAILGGYGSLGDLGATLRRSFQNIQGKILSERIFGDVFRDLDRWVKKETGIKDSVDILKSETERAGSAAGAMADELAKVTSRISGIGTGSAGFVSGPNATTSWAWPAKMSIPDAIRAPGYDKDPNPILVMAQKPKSEQKIKTVNDLRPDDYFTRLYTGMGEALSESLNKTFGTQFFSGLSDALGGAAAGYGVTGSPIGAAAGAAAGQIFGPEAIAAISGPFAAAVQVNKMIGDVVGFEGGPLGVFTGLFKKLFGGGTKEGFAVLSGGGVRTGGNSKQSAVAGESANSLSESLNSIAKAFGTSLGDYAVSIGTRSSGYIRVSGSGSSQVASDNFYKSSDAIYDGKDMEEALKVALKNAIEDGAIQGIRAGSKRLLSIGTDIEAQVEKALKFENVFKSLKAFKDPLGAALDELNTEFKGLIDIFKEAGASAEELAQLEELYGLKRKDALTQAAEASIGPIKSLLESLNIGSDFYSLRDRQASALAAYNPLKARVQAGDTTAFSEFSDAAQSLIDIQRQIYGSTSPFFDLLKEVTQLSQGALDGQQSKIDAASATDSPFAQLAQQQQATVSAIDAQTQALIEALGGRLDTLNDNMIAAIRASVANGSSSDVTSLLSNNGFW